MTDSCSELQSAYMCLSEHHIPTAHVIHVHAFNTAITLGLKSCNWAT